MCKSATQKIKAFMCTFKSVLHAIHTFAVQCDDRHEDEKRFAKIHFSFKLPCTYRLQRDEPQCSAAHARCEICKDPDDDEERSFDQLYLKPCVHFKKSVHLQNHKMPFLCHV